MSARDNVIIDGGGNWNWVANELAASDEIIATRLIKNW